MFLVIYREAVNRVKLRPAELQLECEKQRGITSKAEGPGS